MAMGKVLGGGSSINAMIWARGYKNDWDFFASQVDDPEWNYDSILQLYKRIEDWQGAPDPHYRGTGGPVFIQPAPEPKPIGLAVVEGAGSLGIPTFESNNGRMMESDGGASIADLRARDGKRLSIFRTYTFPYMDRPNLTVLCHSLVTRVIFEGKRATGVEVLSEGRTQRIGVGLEVVLSLGAIHTPKVLMQSGIGDEVELQRHGIPLVQHLPGVGQNLQDHFFVGCIWEYPQSLAPGHRTAESTVFWKSDPRLDPGPAELPGGDPHYQCRGSSPVQPAVQLLDTVARRRAPKKPRTDSSHRPQSIGPRRDRSQDVVSPRRSEGDDCNGATLPRDWQFHRTSSVR